MELCCALRNYQGVLCPGNPWFNRDKLTYSTFSRGWAKISAIA
jgi:hypothetical protein